MQIRSMGMNTDSGLEVALLGLLLVSTLEVKGQSLQGS